MDRLQWLPTALTCSLVSLRADFTAYSHTAYSELAAMVAREPRARGYSLTGVRSSTLADFRMASAICRTKWSGFPHPAGVVDLIAALLIEGF
jgi:hypothetical protein